MEKLLIVRTNPEEGKPVEVKFLSGETRLAVGSFPYATWLQFEKLLKEGLEHRQRQDPKNPRIQITFEAAAVHEAKVTGLRRTPEPPAPRGEIDPDLAAVLAEEEQKVRTETIGKVATTLRGE